MTISDSITSSQAMRVQPQRARGHQRVKTILDTAETLFLEKGYEAVTTNEIAARSRTSIGSLYQFFPNKEAILQAIVERYRIELREMYDSHFTPEVLRRPLPQLMDFLIDSLMEFSRSHQSSIIVMMHVQPGERHIPAIQDLREDWIARLDAILEVHHPDLNPADRKLYAACGLSSANALFSLAMQSNQSGNRVFGRKVIQQVKKVLTAYFSSI